MKKIGILACAILLAAAADARAIEMFTNYEAGEHYEFTPYMGYGCGRSGGGCGCHDAYSGCANAWDGYCCENHHRRDCSSWGCWDCGSCGHHGGCNRGCAAPACEPACEVEPACNDGCGAPSCGHRCGLFGWLRRGHGSRGCEATSDCCSAGAISADEAYAIPANEVSVESAESDADSTRLPPAPKTEPAENADEAAPPTSASGEVELFPQASALFPASEG